jgi:hypothetical protein
MTESYNYQIMLNGSELSIEFDSPYEKDNAVYSVQNISIARGRTSTTFIVRSDDIRTFLDYTNDNNDSSASLDDYIEKITNLINVQTILLNNNILTATGNNPYLFSTYKFGRNPDIDTGTTPEDIWSPGGLYTGHPTGSPETIDIVSSSTNDTSAGTGARTIRLFGLKSNASTAYESEDFTLNGTTTVTSTSTWYRINRVFVLTAGTLGYNEGTITVNHTTTTANVFATIEPQLNQTTIAAYTIPANFTGYLDQYLLVLSRAGGGLGSATVTIRVRDTLNGGVYRSLEAIDMTTGSPLDTRLKYPFRLVEGSDILFRVEDVSDGNSIFNCSFTVVLVDNDA